MMRGFGPPDLSRLSAAVERPGVDPRTWTTLAIVDAVNVTEHGIYCDVTTIMGLQETATLAPDYGGDGYGFYAPIEVGHMVVIEVPEGEWSTGARIIAHVWDQGDKPPQEAVDHPEDVALVVRPGRTVRIVVSGGGTVLLGSADAAKGVGRVGDPVSFDMSKLQAVLDLRYATLPPVGPLPMELAAAAGAAAVTTGDPAVATGQIGEIAIGSDTVKAAD